jgi:hypothetical protein
MLKVPQTWHRIKPVQGKSFHALRKHSSASEIKHQIHFLNGFTSKTSANWKSQWQQIDRRNKFLQNHNESIAIIFVIARRCRRNDG